jgi:tripartite-type tricarboxylate transporter receptor subunit TctC
MKMTLRRTFLASIAAAACWASAPAVAQDAWPSRPVRIVVGFPAGSATDISTRIYAEKLSAHFNQRFVVENMPGHAANRAGEHVARSAADGYTLYVSTNANTTSVTLYPKLPFTLQGDFVQIGTMVSVPVIMAAGKEFPPSTVKDVIALAKQKPGDVTYGSAGVGTGPQLAAELFAAMSETKLTHVPYKGTNEAIADLLTGRLNLLFAALPVVNPHIKGGKIKGIAITTAQRSPLAPEIPTVAESGLAGFDVSLWFGLSVPKGTPEPVVQKLIAALDAIHKDDDTKKKVSAAGADVLPITGARFDRFVADDIPKWKKAIEHSGLKAE